MIVPTRRLAHFLRTRHDAVQLAAGRSVWPTPPVLTWADWVHRAFDEDRVAGRTHERWLDEAHARLTWERIVRRDLGSRVVLSPGGLGGVAYRSWALLHEHRIPLEALASDASPEVHAFAGWVDSYRRWLAHGHWRDPSQAPASVGSPARGTRLEFVGFDRFTPEQADFLERTRVAGVEVVVRPLPAVDPNERARLLECNDFDDELDTAARWAAAQVAARPDARVAIVVPALGRERARVQHVLDRVLAPASGFAGGPWPESSAYELAAARPLIERPVVAAALAWLQGASAPVDALVVSRLLLGGFDAAEGEQPRRAALDVKLRRDGGVAGGLAGAARVAAEAGCPQVAAMFEAVDRRARTWRGVRLPSAWTAEFFALLRETGWPGAGAGSAEHQAAQRLRALLGGFGAADDVIGTVPAQSAVRHVLDLAQDVAFEPQEVSAPILVIDPDTVAGMHFDAVWVCGLDSTRWPSPATPDPFLPRDWQARTHVPGTTAELATQAARATLRRLAAAAPVVVCSTPQFEDEAPLLPSALVAGLPRLEAAELWAGVPASRAQFDARPALERVIDASLPAFAAHELARGGARLIELQSACPFRAAVEFRLGGRALDDLTTGISPTARGTLVHDVLQRFWSEVREQRALLAMGAEERIARVTTHVGDVLAPLRAAADEVFLRLLDLEQAWLEARVHELLAQDAARAPFVVERVEEGADVVVGGVQVHLQLDRVDRLQDGSYAVIDYKTGRKTQPAAWMGERPELPQLPLYVRAVGADRVKAVAFGVVRNGATGYTGYVADPALFGELKPFVAGKGPFKDYADWRDLLQAWHRRLETLGLEHAGGDAQLAPNPTKACRYCHLPGLCRSTQATLEAEEGDDDDA